MNRYIARQRTDMLRINAEIVVMEMLVELDRDAFAMCRLDEYYCTGESMGML